MEYVSWYHYHLGISQIRGTEQSRFLVYVSWYYYRLGISYIRGKGQSMVVVYIIWFHYLCDMATGCMFNSRHACFRCIQYAITTRLITTANESHVVSGFFRSSKKYLESSQVVSSHKKCCSLLINRTNVFVNLKSSSWWDQPPPDEISCHILPHFRQASFILLYHSLSKASLLTCCIGW